MLLFFFQFLVYNVRETRRGMEPGTTNERLEHDERIFAGKHFDSPGGFYGEMGRNRLRPIYL